MILKLNTTKEAFLFDYLQLVNVAFNLSAIELKVLTKFVELYLYYSSSPSSLLGISKDEQTKLNWKRTFDSSSRKIVMDNLGFTKRTNIDQYIKRIKDKKAFSNKKGYLEINSMLIPNKEDNELVFRFSIQR